MTEEALSDVHTKVQAHCSALRGHASREKMLTKRKKNDNEIGNETWKTVAKTFCRRCSSNWIEDLSGTPFSFPVRARGEAMLIATAFVPANKFIIDVPWKKTFLTLIQVHRGKWEALSSVKEFSESVENKILPGVLLDNEHLAAHSCDPSAGARLYYAYQKI
ncbi:hypothetical protein PUN28_010251 [Cardiocondyla obscurior]|uniref:Uncharacterized protein n=1 Tax=Cardiocondyla obscurior TaxID=286306 RepID=A0AAW2FPC3_9HYME